jgi:hypothetical protein
MFGRAKGVHGVDHAAAVIGHIRYSKKGYRMISRGRRLTPSPANTAETPRSRKPCFLYSVRYLTRRHQNTIKTNSVDLSPQANYTD